MLRLIFILTLTFLPFSAHAAQDCLRAEQSAQTHSCLSQAYDRALDRLQNIYSRLQNSGDVNSAALETSQQQWIAYRDAQCGFETGQIDNESLKKIQELACLHHLTVKRADHLEDQHHSLGMGVHQRLEKLPRWMNALAADAPATFWRYGAAVQGDLNCDGTVDDMMIGLQYKADPELVVAIAQSAETGRPAIDLLSFPLMNEEGETCSADMRLDFTAGMATPEHKPGEEAPADAARHCTARLTLSDSVCGNRLMGWDGGAFTMIEPDDSP